MPLMVRAVSSGMTRSPVGKMENPVKPVNAVAVDLSAENFRILVQLSNITGSIISNCS